MPFLYSILSVLELLIYFLVISNMICSRRVRINLSVSNVRGIGLISVPVKIYGRIVTERLMQATEKVCDGQGDFRRREICVDYIFAFEILVKEYLGKDRKLYVVFMDLEKENGKVDREALWKALKIYGVGGEQMEGMKAFYREANACVKVDRELNDRFPVEVGVR